MPPKPAASIPSLYPALLAYLDARIRAQAEALLHEDTATDTDAWKRRELSELLDLAYKVRRHIAES